MFYSNELVSNLTQTSICITSYFCFRYSLGHLDNLSIAFLFVCNSRAYITESGLITKKKKPL